MKQTIALIAAMVPELELLQQSLHKPQTVELLGQTFYRGHLGGHEVVLALSGIGKVNAALTAAAVLTHFHAAAVINTGSAGGLGKGIRIGDVVIGRESAHHDVDVSAFGYVLGQVPQLPPRFAAAPRLLAAATQAAAEDDAAVHEALIVSGDQFVHGAEEIAAIRAAFPDAAACEMEAAAIAQVCHRANVPFVVIRAISDHADEQAEHSFEEFITLAGRRSAQMVMRLLAALPLT